MAHALRALLATCRDKDAMSKTSDNSLSRHSVRQANRQILVWQTDGNCNPLGVERKLVANSVRRALEHVASTRGGRLSASRKCVHCPDGTMWLGSAS